MTFKHTKFDESAIMRSFEKTARNKGLITDEPAVYGLVKQAASKIDLKPTENLTLNIVKLCEGLRSKGFSKYANEIENKFMTYKIAETLYDVHNETGEDVVDQAHPDGSHKLEGVEGDSTFETILDQHEMIKKVVDKNPTGKLSNNKDILKAVKIVLAQSGAGGAPSAEQYEDAFMREIAQAYKTTIMNAIIKYKNFFGFARSKIQRSAEEKMDQQSDKSRLMTGIGKYESELYENSAKISKVMASQSELPKLKALGAEAMNLVNNIYYVIDKELLEKILPVIASQMPDKQKECLDELNKSGGMLKQDRNVYNYTSKFNGFKNSLNNAKETINSRAWSGETKKIALDHITSLDNKVLQLKDYNEDNVKTLNELIKGFDEFKTKWKL